VDGILLLDLVRLLDYYRAISYIATIYFVVRGIVKLKITSAEAKVVQRIIYRQQFDVVE
jgi:hypothetical protein